MTSNHYSKNSKFKLLFNNYKVLATKIEELYSEIQKNKSKNLDKLLSLKDMLICFDENIKLIQTQFPDFFKDTKTQTDNLLSANQKFIDAIDKDIKELEALENK